MEKGAEKILAKHGCLYMRDDYKALFEELEAYYKPTEEVKNNAVLPCVSGSFSAEEKAKIHKYHKQTLDKVNKLYKYLYDRTICATELSDQPNEAFAYLQLSDDVKEAYRKFSDAVCALANER